MVPLNLTRGYGVRSGWGAQDGFRELIQNLYITNLPSPSRNSSVQRSDAIAVLTTSWNPPMAPSEK